MVEIDVGVGEIVMIEFEESEEVQVMDALDPIDEEIELQDLNDHPWIFKDKIDRSHDEWYESMGIGLKISKILGVIMKDSGNCYSREDFLNGRNFMSLVLLGMFI